MSADSKRTSDFLGHILEAISRIGRYTDQMNIADFQENELVQDAVIRNMEVIGEACGNIRKLAPAFVQSHPEVPWSSAIGNRNALSHGYFSVDLKLVWATVKSDLPTLKLAVERLRVDPS